MEEVPFKPSLAVSEAQALNPSPTVLPLHNVYSITSETNEKGNLSHPNLQRDREGYHGPDVLAEQVLAPGSWRG